MNINKSSTKTKKRVKKLTKKYCPLANEIANTPKNFSHINNKQQPQPSTSGITDNKVVHNNQQNLDYKTTPRYNIDTEACGQPPKPCQTVSRCTNEVVSPPLF